MLLNQDDIIDSNGFEFVIQTLTENAPRVKWESAMVIGNTACLFPKLLKKASIQLLYNTGNASTVDRWSAAYALSEIILCKTRLNKELIPAIESNVKREKQNIIRKIYLHAP